MGRQERNAKLARIAEDRAAQIIAAAIERARVKRCRSCGATGPYGELRDAGHPDTCEPEESCEEPEPGATVDMRHTLRSRKAAVREGWGVIPRGQTEAEVEEFLRGKKIRWSIDLQRLAGGKGDPYFAEEEARVTPDADFVLYEEINGAACVRFREVLGMDKEGNPISGPTRTVRLAAIHTVV